MAVGGRVVSAEFRRADNVGLVDEDDVLPLLDSNTRRRTLGMLFIDG